MKGLIYKDFLLIQRQGKVLIYLLLFYMVFFLLLGRSASSSVSGGNIAGIISAIAVMMEIILIINTFAYDESSKWDEYALSLPVGIKGIVGAKYLFILLFSAFMALFSFLLEAILMKGKISSEDILGVLAGSGLDPLFFCAVLLPIIYRFGLQKARFSLVFIVLIPIMIASLVKNYSFSWENVLCYFPFLTCLLWIGSYLLSCRLYARHPHAGL